MGLVGAKKTKAVAKNNKQSATPQPKPKVKSTKAIQKKQKGKQKSEHDMDEDAQQEEEEEEKKKEEDTLAMESVSRRTRSAAKGGVKAKAFVETKPKAATKHVDVPSSKRPKATSEPKLSAAAESSKWTRVKGSNNNDPLPSIDDIAEMIDRISSGEKVFQHVGQQIEAATLLPRELTKLVVSYMHNEHSALSVLGSRQSRERLMEKWQDFLPFFRSHTRVLYGRPLYVTNVDVEKECSDDDRDPAPLYQSCTVLIPLPTTTTRTTTASTATTATTAKGASRYVHLRLSLEADSFARYTPFQMHMEVTQPWQSILMKDDTDDQDFDSERHTRVYWNELARLTRTLRLAEANPTELLSALYKCCCGDPAYPSAWSTFLEHHNHRCKKYAYPNAKHATFAKDENDDDDEEENEKKEETDGKDDDEDSRSQWSVERAPIREDWSSDEEAEESDSWRFAWARLKAWWL